MKKRKFMAGVLSMAMLTTVINGNGPICEAEDVTILEDFDQADQGQETGTGEDVSTQEPSAQEPSVQEPSVQEPPVQEPSVQEPQIPESQDVPTVPQWEESYESEWMDFEGENIIFEDENPDKYDFEETVGSIHRISETVKGVDDYDIPGKEKARLDFDLPEELPSSISLDVPVILQKPALPTGCEAVSLTMALQFEGFDVDKIAVADEFLIRNYETDNMAEGYVGDPFSEEGAGCFPTVIAATANFFFEDQKEEYTAYNLTGSTMDELLAYVAAGTPVMVWTTMYMAEPEFTREDSEYDGHTYRWYRQEHCVVVTGYDLENGCLNINDPLEGAVIRDMEEFSRIYTKTGENAVVLREKNVQNTAVSGDAGETAESNRAVTEAGVQ